MDDRIGRERSGRPVTKLSDETREKMRKAHLGMKASKEAREKMRKAHLGKKLSEETKEKISKANLGKILSEETKEKLSKAHLGKKLSEETKEKMRKAHLGKRLSEETKEKMRQTKARLYSNLPVSKIVEMKLASLRNYVDKLQNNHLLSPQQVIYYRRIILSELLYLTKPGVRTLLTEEAIIYINEIVFTAFENSYIIPSSKPIRVQKKLDMIYSALK